MAGFGPQAAGHPGCSLAGQCGAVCAGGVHACREAQEAFTKALDEAVRVYGEGDRAYRAAFTAAGGAGGGTPKGLAGKRRRVAARAGFIMTSMSP